MTEKQPVLRAAYTVVVALLMPWALLRLCWRARREPTYLHHLAERFGFFQPASARHPVWVHAVSMGEVRAATPLVRALQARGYPILLTCMTATGRATAIEQFGSDATVQVVWLPWDLPFALRRLLRHFQPSMLLLMETEIWFNLIACTRAAGIPVWLVNARLSARSAAAYARFTPIAGLTRAALQRLTGIAAQSAADAERLRVLGDRSATVCGNMKFDMPIAPALMELGRVWRTRLAPGRKVLTLAVTREGEEPLLLAAWARAFDSAARQACLLVIVPRHPQRFAAVADEIAIAGWRVGRRSQLDQNSDPAVCDVWVGDSVREMAAYYAMSDLALIGGSFLPLGGQNLIEAAAVGCPTLVGPHVFNFTEAVHLGVAAGAVQQVADADAAMVRARELLADPSALERMADAARAFALAHRGATARTVDLVLSSLSAPAGD